MAPSIFSLARNRDPDGHDPSPQGCSRAQSPRNASRLQQEGKHLPRTGVSAILPPRLFFQPKRKTFCTTGALHQAVTCSLAFPLAARRWKSRTTAWKTPKREVRLPGEGVMWKGKGCLAAWLGKDTTSTIVPAPQLPELRCPTIVPRFEG